MTVNPYRYKYFATYHFIVILGITFVSLANRGCTNAESNCLCDAIKEELKLHPEANIVDIYKLAYQGEFGVGHLIPNKEFAKQMLMAELEGIQPNSIEPLLQPCNNEGTQFRINLKTFLSKKYDPDTLVDAMMLSAILTHGDTARFKKRWSHTKELLCEIAPERFGKEIETFTHSIQAHNFPVLHHSDRYHELYAPAYRVLHKTALKKYFPDVHDRYCPNNTGAI